MILYDVHNMMMVAVCMVQAYKHNTMIVLIITCVVYITNTYLYFIQHVYIII